MKKLLLLIIILIGASTFAQKLEKIKGSKIVITTERTFDTIKGIELHKNLKIDVVKGNENKLVIFADDNLHDIVLTNISDGILDIDLSNKITRKKKFEITLYLTNLEQVTLNDSSELTNNEYFNNENVIINLNDKSEGNLMFDAGIITLNANDHSKGELILKAKEILVNLQESSKIELGLTADKLKVEANQKSSIKLEGKSTFAEIIANNNTRIRASNLKIDDAIVQSDNNTLIYINSTKTIDIRAKGKTKIYLFGNAKINLSIFKDNASLLKK
jgi:hypothetical protein